MLRRFLAVALLAGCSQNAVVEVDHNPDDVVDVMSFNIWHDRDWALRQELVVEAIRQADPDVIGLQEALVWQLDYLVEQLPGSEFVGVGRDDGTQNGESVGVVFKKARFKLESSGTFWFSDDPDMPGSISGPVWGSPTFPRICTWLRLVHVTTGRALYVFNVHFQHDAGADPELARTNSAALLLERIEQRDYDDPVIVTGDFNATEDEVPVRHLTGTGPLRYCPESSANPCRVLSNAVPLVDTQRVLHAGAIRGTRCFGNADAGRRIDYVFSSPGVDVIDFRVGEKIDGLCPSDHHYVHATVAPWHGHSIEQ